MTPDHPHRRTQSTPEMSGDDADDTERSGRVALGQIRVLALKLEAAITAAQARDAIVSEKVDALIIDLRDARGAVLGNTAAIIAIDKNVDEMRREVIANRGVAKHAADHSLAALQAATEAAAQQEVLLTIVRGIDARLGSRVDAVVEEHHNFRDALAKLTPRQRGGAFVVALTAFAGVIKFCIDLWFTTKGLK